MMGNILFDLPRSCNILSFPGPLEKQTPDYNFGNSSIHIFDCKSQGLVAQAKSSSVVVQLLW
jgi:hypothetical protein